MKNILLIILCVFTTQLFSQSINGITEEGKKVILNQDGTWLYDTSNNKNTKSNSDCKYWKNEVDEFTGDVKMFTKGKIIGKNKIKTSFKMELRRVNDNYYIYGKYYGDLGCVTSDSYMIIKLLNGETIKLMNFGDIDCGDMSLFFFLKQETLDQVLKSPIEKIRIQGTEYYTDIDNMKLPNYFIDEFPCIKK